jgi:hypothetical protein
VKAAGLEPRSEAMKAVFVGLGVAGLVALVAFGWRAAWGRAAMVAVATATLWYLPFGTLSSALQLVLLLLLPLR